VCHGGFNTLIGAFSAEVPTLCLPLGADQPVNATCAGAAGDGINAANAPGDFRGPVVDPEQLEPEAIAIAIMRLTHEPTFTDAAGRLAGEIQAMPGPSAAARTLEQLTAIDAAAPQARRSAVA
jgi:calicheamicin 3'-O-methyl-rhamnosyltransferase